MRRARLAWCALALGTARAVVRLTVLRAASRADAGKPFADEVAAAHTLCAQRGAAIGSNGVQLLGGHGYVKDHPVERWYRDLQAVGAIEGGLVV